MQFPEVVGVMARRILINYRVDPCRIAGLLPYPFRPKMVGGFAMVGICLIRLRDLRPRFLPIRFGIGSENAAHRFAVEWESNDALQSGVYIPRRDSSSWVNALAGGRLFPGLHHHAKFAVDESDRRFRVGFTSSDGQASAAVDAYTADRLASDSVFESQSEAIEFFRGGSVGYSPMRRPGCYEGLALCCENWRLEPLAVDHVSSSMFDDERLFPAGTVKFDSAFLMRNVDHSWQGQPQLAGTIPAMTPSLPSPAAMH